MGSKDVRISAADYRAGRIPAERTAPAVTDLSPAQGEPDAGRESAIQAEIVRSLRAFGFTAFHVPNGGKRRRVEAAILKGMGTLPGVADICVMFSEGRVAWIEVKAGNGRVSQAQRDFAATCKFLRHPYFVARNAADALRFVLDQRAAA